MSIATKRAFVLSIFSFATALGVGTTPVAHAQEPWPSKPIRFVVPQSAGSGSDVVARLIGEKLSKSLGQPFVIENIPAANGLVAMTTVAKAPADGYTVLMGGISQVAFNPTLYANLPYDPAKQFTYVSGIVESPLVLITSPQSQIKKLSDLVEKAKKADSNLTYSSAGVGNSTHIAMELIASAAGVKLLHVPYKGTAPAITAVMSGEVDAMVTVVGSVLPQVRAGRVNAVAVLGDKRVPQWPDVATTWEGGVNMQPMSPWFALLAPAELSAPIAERLNKALGQALADSTVKTQLAEMSYFPMVGTQADMRQRAHADLTFWTEFIKKSGIRAE